MSVFDEYATYYDFLYADKDYAGEATFVRDVIRRHAPEAQSIVEFGCGSCRHAVELVRCGFSITGVERSVGMIAHAQERLRALPSEQSQRINIVKGDATTYSGAANSDAVISLFHVASYQTTNDALVGFFSSARSALRPNGLLVFDFWYGAAVLSQGTELRIKRIEQGDLRAIRISEPVHKIDQNLVDVNFTLLAWDVDGKNLREIKETHTMRYLFLPELDHFAATAGFEIVESGEWMTGAPLHASAWGGYVAARLIH